MYTVYVLQDENGKSYTGMTNDLSRRSNEHIRGKTRSTRGMKKIVVIYQERCETREKARIREKYLKSAAGRRFVSKTLTASS